MKSDPHLYAELFEGKTEVLTMPLSWRVMHLKWLFSLFSQASPDVDEEGFSLRPGDDGDDILAVTEPVSGAEKSLLKKNYLTCLAERLSGQILLSIKWAKSIVPPSLASSHVYVPAAIIELNRAASRPSPCNRAAVINSWPLVRPYFTFLPLQVSAAAGLAESSETSPRAG